MKDDVLRRTELDRRSWDDGMCSAHCAQTTWVIQDIASYLDYHCNPCSTLGAEFKEIKETNLQRTLERHPIFIESFLLIYSVIFLMLRILPSEWNEVHIPFVYILGLKMR